ncbi:ABC transporter [Kineosporia sp. NBRC 101677]|uniref:ATP-binding cassette domain-containing protein n=1 Tax=Kineosporia sp. NBRC 101677 TaxID=3032197 RepID=UPI0024A609F1|nr:ATP-binding cassette domain-containing protein [Kineosporia sp. NBRC 101677]GLY15208.1 ABC transporter [Kineosporia sp. NBRC 101677]
MIIARGLARRFDSGGRTVEAVRGVDLDVAAGEIVAFLGPNGAGKTTTLRMLATLLKPTGGHAVVGGHDLSSDPMGVRRNIGYVAQGGGTVDDRRVNEEILLQGRLYGLSRRAAAERAAAVLQQFELTGLEHRLCSTLSGGQRRRLDTALGLVHSPGLVFLDEPTSGLDPQSRNNLWNHIRALRRDHGLAVFLTTHYLDEADQLADRVIVIDRGRIVAEETPARLKTTVSGDTVTLTVPGDQAGPASQVVQRHPGTAGLQVLPRAEDPRTHELRFRVPEGDRAVPELLRALDTAGVRAGSVQVRRPSLDDVFFALTGTGLREPGTPADHLREAVPGAH